MTIANKYNIPVDTIKKMVNDGILPCQTHRNDEIYTMYSKIKNSGISKEKMYLDIAAHFKVSESSVRQVVKRIDKI
jgi:hypothetical protein